ncbi:DegV family protein [Mesomycoplasma molare]|uniref:DegV family protein n=1 Tax=Mesomycoplasma molare TaxID=171288 RepID=A0ABY5TXJ6_9BACT|nr:DegV family protein [Mesomycoplasma molare]UWD33953.1 DegV family protein [Mesomycoplasma molare]
MKIAIIVDSATGLTKKMAEKMDLYFLPLYINIDDKEFADGIDLESGEILKHVTLKSKVSTSATPLGSALELVEYLNSKYDKIIIYPISEGLSSQYANLKATFSNNKKVYVVKSNKVTLLSIIDILNFRNNVMKNMNLDSAIEKMEEDYKGKFLLIPKYNDALVRGGRLSPSAASIAKLLKIVPVIKLENGKLQKEGKGRIFRKTLFNFYKENFDLYKSNIKNLRTIIIHSGNKEINEIKEEFESYSNSKIELFDIPNTIAIHTGLEAVAFGILDISDEQINFLKMIFQQ